MKTTTTKTTKRQPKSIDLDMSLPPADASRETLTKRLRELEQVGLDFNRRLGRVRWLQGHILLRLKPQYSPKEWKAFLKSVDCSQSMDKYCRAIARKISPTQSKRLGYFDMLQICFPSFRREMEKPEADEVQAGTEPGASGQSPAGEAPALAAPVQVVQPVQPEAVTADTIRRAFKSWTASLDAWLAAGEIVGEVADLKDLRTLADGLGSRAVKLGAKLSPADIEERIAA